jgi:protein tyrosine phosphatase (PTP) superfamily phosphohydrolase (DUF442 family)
MFGYRSRAMDYVIFAVLVIAGLTAFVRVAMPFAVIPGRLAPNYVEVSSRLSFAGMPTGPQFADIASTGFEVVVNLATSDIPGELENEAALVEQAGMQYFSNPVNFASPRLTDFEQFSRIMRANREKRVLVHCRTSMRASSFVFLFRVTELGEDPDRAFEAAERVWQPNEQWRQFMRAALIAQGRPLPRGLGG